MSLLYNMALMASRAYLREWPDEHMYDKHWLIEDHRTGAACHIALMGNILYVLPRGLEPHDYRDWVTVLHAGGRDFSGLHGKVHRGMALAWESMEPRVIHHLIDCLIENPYLEIRLAGHSMGGALCRFAHWKLLSFTSHIHSWTFGAPGQFTRAGAYQWNQECESTSVQLVNGLDFVPWIARLAGWHPGGTLVYLDSTGERRTGWSKLKLWWYRLQLMRHRGPLTGGLRDHEVQAYIDALEEYPNELTGQTPAVDVIYNVNPLKNEEL